MRFQFRFGSVLLALVGCWLFPVAGTAQIELQGNVHDGNVGPLLSGQVYVATGRWFVPAGRTLTVQAGAIVKLGKNIPEEINVAAGGKLIVNGTAASPVYFTSYADDSVGGDTNGDGPSTGAPNDWRSIRANAFGAEIRMRHTHVRFGGAVLVAAVEASGPAFTFDDCSISASGSRALYLGGETYTQISVKNSAFVNNTGVAVSGVLMNALAGFSGNTASGNGGDYIDIQGANLTANLALTTSQMLNGTAAIVMASMLRVPAGVTLTLGPGVVLKWRGQSLVEFYGTVQANGTAQAPVVFSSFADDAVAGDTNNDGPSTGMPGDWQYVRFRNTAANCSLRHTHFRFGGSGTQGAMLQIESSDVSLDRCEVRSCDSNGIGLSALAVTPTVKECSIVNNKGFAFDGVPMSSIPGFVNNTASGNMGDYINVRGTIGNDAAIGPENVTNGALVLGGNLNVPAGRRIVLHPGVVIKSAAKRVDVSGALDLLGTAAEPIIFTSLADDAHAGDTNQDGPSNGTAGDWGGIFYRTAAVQSALENVLTRYTGASGSAAYRFQSPNISARSIRAEHATREGMIAEGHVGPAVNWVAFDCALTGIRLDRGTFDLLHATVAATAGDGIRRLGAYGGSARNCIAWGNTTNYDGFTAATLFDSNGSSIAGSGNINGDPLFSDASLSAGDLRLRAGSPCLNTAGVAAAMTTVRDHDENSRLLDHDLTGAMLPDMGAYERPAFFMVVAGEPILGTTLGAAVFGPAGVSVFAVGRLDLEAAISPFGFLTVGNPATFIVASPPVPTGQVWNVAVPSDNALIGVMVGLQTISVPNGNPAVGNITNLYRARLRG